MDILINGSKMTCTGMVALMSNGHTVAGRLPINAVSTHLFACQAGQALLLRWLPHSAAA